MQKFLLLALTLMFFGNAMAVVDRVQQQNAICYEKPMHLTLYSVSCHFLATENQKNLWLM
jgi:hypothetical protein